MKALGIAAGLLVFMILAMCAIIQLGEYCITFGCWISAFNWQPLKYFILNNSFTVVTIVILIVICIGVAIASYRQGKFAGKIEEAERQMDEAERRHEQ